MEEMEADSSSEGAHQSQHRSSLEEKWIVVSICMPFVDRDHLQSFVSGTSESLNLAPKSWNIIHPILQSIGISSCEATLKKIFYEFKGLLHGLSTKTHSSPPITLAPHLDHGRKRKAPNSSQLDSMVISNETFGGREVCTANSPEATSAGASSAAGGVKDREFNANERWVMLCCCLLNLDHYSVSTSQFS